MLVNLASFLIKPIPTLESFKIFGIAELGTVFYGGCIKFYASYWVLLLLMANYWPKKRLFLKSVWWIAWLGGAIAGFLFAGILY